MDAFEVHLYQSAESERAHRRRMPLNNPLGFLDGSSTAVTSDATSYGNPLVGIDGERGIPACCFRARAESVEDERG